MNKNHRSRFWYWVKERHRIYLRKEKGKPPPWTSDEILQTIFFTNPYREHDKTTVWFREHLRDTTTTFLESLMHTVIFRWFNKIETAQILWDYDLFCNWDRDKAIALLKKIDGPVFTGAYIIKSPDGFDKITGICNCIQNVWRDRKQIVQHIRKYRTLQAAHSKLMEYPYLGGFMAYEIVCDLRFTPLLDKASDIMTWTNLGPGAKRGIRRLLGLTPKGPLPPNSQELIQELLLESRQRLPSHMPDFEMREVEHSLCEFDKYERVRLNEGTIKRKYKS